ncbi:odorant receptor 43b-like [Zeugodacus cucurbitae]|uniref:odorant receptor 43b-like n=1 Tax=Zeugodacus cucurbitae TaxID=28588 RepID=UPI0023D8F643|nr:odorant receptor 43b-like [Zeugodacus cucurbitae]
MRNIADLYYGRGKDDFGTSESFVLLFRSWRLLGFITAKPYRITNLMLVVFIWACLIFSPITYFGGLVLAMKELPITVVLSILGVAINCLALPTKAVYIRANLYRLYDVETIFKRLDARYQRPQDQLLIRDLVKSCTRIFGIFFIVYWIYGIASALAGLFAHKYPHDSYVPFIDWMPNSNLKFWLHFSFEVVYAQIMLQTNVTNDSFPAIYIHAIRTHIKLLTERVSRLGTNPDLSEQENFDELVDCIVTHQEVLKISKIVGSILSLTTFFQFTVYAAIVCICMLNMFVFGDATTKLVTVSYIIPVLWQTIPTCYQASMLVTDCTKLPLAIFHSNWLALDKRCHKLIIYFMQRTQDEISFTAIKMFQINLGTNLSIAKFSFTLYTFINEMGFGETLKERLE